MPTPNNDLPLLSPKSGIYRIVSCAINRATNLFLAPQLQAKEYSGPNGGRSYDVGETPVARGKARARWDSRNDARVRRAAASRRGPGAAPDRRPEAVARCADSVRLKTARGGDAPPRKRVRNLLLVPPAVVFSPRHHRRRAYVSYWDDRGPSGGCTTPN